MVKLKTFIEKLSKLHNYILYCVKIVNKSLNFISF